MTTDLKPTKLKGFLDGLGGNDIRKTRWLTPRPLVESLGHFDLDPCGAPGWELADRTFLLENGEDGLELPWEGRVWCNPPYGKEAYPFLRRMVQHRHGTALIFARVETEMFFETVWEGATSVLFLKGRLTFLDDLTFEPAKANSGAPSCLVAYGAEDTRALAYSGLPGRLVLIDKTLTPRKALE